MPIQPIPIDRYLVPPLQISVPEGFTAVSQTITAGLPQTIALSDDLTLLVVVPNGLAHAWRDADPVTLISSSAPELAPSLPAPAEAIGSVGRLPARLLLRRGGDTLASAPLVAGLHRRLPDAGDEAAGVAIELVIVGWELHAGNLRGPGDFSARIDLAWRLADRGVDFYSELPEVPPFLYKVRDLIATAVLFPKVLLQIGVRLTKVKARF